MDETTVPVETYPWDRTEPYIPHPSVSLVIGPDTPIKVHDYPYDPDQNRVTLVRLAELDLHVGISGGDAEVIDICGRLIAAFAELRDNAARRMAEPLPTVDDVRGILADRSVPA